MRQENQLFKDTNKSLVDNQRVWNSPVKVYQYQFTTYTPSSLKRDDKGTELKKCISNKPIDMLQLMRPVRVDQKYDENIRIEYEKFQNSCESTRRGFDKFGVKNIRVEIMNRIIPKEEMRVQKNQKDSVIKIFDTWTKINQKIERLALKTIKKYLTNKRKQKLYYFKKGLSDQILSGLEINNHICTIVDHNDALMSSYAHFHILLYLSNSQILSCYDGKNELLLTVNNLIIQHLQQPSIRKQLSELDYYTVMSFLVGIRKNGRTQILDFMRNFIRQNEQILMGVCPYYYNLFSLVVNKPIVFESKQPNREQLMEYTVEYTHPIYYEGKFCREDVQRQVRQLQKLLIQKYHSGEE